MRSSGPRSWRRCDKHLGEVNRSVNFLPKLNSVFRRCLAASYLHDWNGEITFADNWRVCRLQGLPAFQKATPLVACHSMARPHRETVRNVVWISWTNLMSDIRMSEYGEGEHARGDVERICSCPLQHLRTMVRPPSGRLRIFPFERRQSA